MFILVIFFLQKPIALQGHERAITQIKYNTDGDLLFSCAKDNTPNVWYSVNGERLGTLDGHQGMIETNLYRNCYISVSVICTVGAVWTIDCNWDSTKVVTGGGDNFLILWDLETGKVISELKTKTAVRTANFSFSGKYLLYTTDQTMKLPAELHIIDINNASHFDGSGSIMSAFDLEMSKPTSSLWGPLDEFLLTGHDKGEIVKWDIRIPNSRLQELDDVHKSSINDMQYNSDQTMFITSSKDTTAKVCFLN